MNTIIDKARQFQYTSLEYADFDDISNAIVCINNNNSLFLYCKAEGIAKIDWAADTKMSFFGGLNETINIVTQDETIKKAYIEFIPEQYIPEMEEQGFIIISEWVDFWNNSLTTICIEQPDSLLIRKIREKEYNIVSDITRSCKGYSRGYTGETAEWIKEWSESENSCIFAAEMNNEIIGMCCVNLYGFESEKGAVLWLRELAVKPEYHSQKIGLNLAAFAISWGKSNGAVRSFLACDADNVKAIKLYEGLGYERKTLHGQVNMGKTLQR